MSEHDPLGPGHFWILTSIKVWLQLGPRARCHKVLLKFPAEPVVTAFIMADELKHTDIQKTDAVKHVDELEFSSQKNETELPQVDEAWRVRERRLVRKLDMTLMPTIWVLYLFNYLDRNNIAYAL